MSCLNSILFKFLAVILVFSTLVESNNYQAEKRKVCIVQPSRNSSDDAPAILQAFNECGKNGRVEFLNETYHIESIMNITGLKNVEIDLKGTLLVGTPSAFTLYKS